MTQILAILMVLSSALAFTGPINPLSASTVSSTAMHYLQEPIEENKDLLNKQSTTVATSPASTAAAAAETATKASFTTCASQQADAKSAIDELIKRLLEGDNAYGENNNQQLDLVYLFVGQYHAESFEEIVSYLQSKLGKSNGKNYDSNVEIVTILGGGVIGGGAQLDQTDAPAMTLLAGTLPPDSSAAVFQYEEGVDNSMKEALARTTATKIQQQDKEQTKRPPSYMIFSDPFAPLDDLMAHLEAPSRTNLQLPPPVVAGGISVPPRRKQVPSIARNGHLLPAGSLVGIEFTGNVGLMAVVSQGCRPVGPTFVITQASGTILTGLSGESAITRLEEVAAEAEEQDQELIRNGEIVCGVGSSNTNIVDNSSSVTTDPSDYGMCYDAEEGDDKERMIRMEDDFLIRQIMGFQPKSGSIVVAAGGLKEGSIFRFHVRAARSAREDMDLMIQRAKTERLFAGSMFSKSGSATPLAAFQISCVARDSSFYGAPDVDLKKVEKLFDDDESSSKDAPVAGFFANGEIGPVGIRSAEMAAKDAEQTDNSVTNTFLHGFTTVVAMLCDYSGTSSASQSTGEVSPSAILGGMDDDAWA